MAQAAIGVDMLEISRMERALAAHPSFVKRVFSAEEISYCQAAKRPAEHFAARWAAREAVLKALGIGFSEGVRFKDVSVGRYQDGRPHVILEGKAKEVAESKGIQEVAISLSHTRGVAVANAVAVTEEVRPAPDEKKDAAKELAASFKQAKTVLDELDRLQDNIIDTLDDQALDYEVDAGIEASNEQEEKQLASDEIKESVD